MLMLMTRQIPCPGTRIRVVNWNLNLWLSHCSYSLLNVLSLTSLLNDCSANKLHAAFWVEDPPRE